jgi:hypothetical protein
MGSNLIASWVPVAHAYNPSYSGGRDQEDHCLKPAPGKQFWRTCLKKQNKTKKNPQQIIIKKAGGVAQGVGPELKPQYRKYKTNKKPILISNVIV